MAGRRASSGSTACGDAAGYLLDPRATAESSKAVALRTGTGKHLEPAARLLLHCYCTMDSL